jgi:hypothetical protein
MRSGWCLALLLVAAFVSSGSPAAANILVTVDKLAQQLTVSRDGALLYRWSVSTGRPGRDTPNGRFRAFRLERDHYSKEWDDAPMPHSIFFTQQGHAIHGSYEVRKIGTPVSAGCIRLHPEHAAKLFELVEQTGVLKTTVVVTGQTPAAVARRAVPRPAVVDDGYARPESYARPVRPPLVIAPDDPDMDDDWYARRPRYPVRVSPFPWD